MKVFVINLRKSADRKKHMKKQLDRLGIAYEFVDAVDGKALTDQEIKMHGLETFPPWPSFNARQLSRSEIGCLLSHLAIYKRMIAENIEWACIFEDDAVLGENLETLLKGMADHLARYGHELLLLGHHGWYHDFSRGAEYFPKRRTDFSCYRVVKAVELPYGTYAYTIKQSAARKLLEEAYPLRMPMDHLTGYAVAIGVRMCILTPPCVTCDPHLFPSTIDNRDRRSDCLYLHQSRRMQCFWGEKYPILRTIQKIVLYPYIMIPLKLRKAGLLERDSYADKRYFKSKENALGEYERV